MTSARRSRSRSSRSAPRPRPRPPGRRAPGLRSGDPARRAAAEAAALRDRRAVRDLAEEVGLPSVLVRAMVAVDEAELRGDAVGALEAVGLAERVSGEPRFWRPWRRRRLVELATLGPLLPGWVRGRWVLEQALQDLDPEAGRRHTVALERAVEVRGGPGTLVGVDDLDARCRVVDHDWVHRQLWLYDLGGLDAFLRTHRGAPLLDDTDHVERWSSAPLRGLQYAGPHGAHHVRWVDAHSGEVVLGLDLGAAASLLRGDHVLARLVATEHGLVPESLPLRVPQATAAEVARDPAGWADALARACRAGAASSGRVRTAVVRTTGLLHDVPDLAWRGCALAVHEARVLRGLGGPEDEWLLTRDAQREATAEAGEAGEPGEAGVPGEAEVAPAEAARLVRRAVVSLLDEALDVVAAARHHEEPGGGPEDATAPPAAETGDDPFWPCVAAALLSPEGLDAVGLVPPARLRALELLAGRLTAPASRVAWAAAQELRASSAAAPGCPGPGRPSPTGRVEPDGAVIGFADDASARARGAA